MNELVFNKATMLEILDHYLRSKMLTGEASTGTKATGIRYNGAEGTFIVSVQSAPKAS